MAERDRIAQHFAPLAHAEPGSFDLTDDAARLSLPTGKQLVVTTDSVIAGIHVLKDATATQMAEKLVRRNLSDLAAMGATPWRYLVNLHIPARGSEAWVAAFAAALLREQKHFHMVLAGGDSTSGKAPIHTTMTCLGLVDGAVMLRSTAHAGDDVYVSGSIGDAALGLKILQEELTAPPEETAFLTSRYHLPEPRLALGAAIRRLASAAIDISDGLLADAHQVAAASKVMLELERALIPLSPAAQHLVEKKPELWASILGGGDDYELLFTAPTRARDFLSKLGTELKLPITRIGRVSKGSGVTLDAQAVPATGWEHA